VAGDEAQWRCGVIVMALLAVKQCWRAAMSTALFRAYGGGHNASGIVEQIRSGRGRNVDLSRQIEACTKRTRIDQLHTLIWCRNNYASVATLVWVHRKVQIPGWTHGPVAVLEPFYTSTGHLAYIAVLHLKVLCDKRSGASV